MKVRYLVDTDKKLMGLRTEPAAETRDFDENTARDMDAHGNVCSIMFEHVSQTMHRST